MLLSPDACNSWHWGWGWGWAGLKLELGDSIWSVVWMAGIQVLESFLSICQGIRWQETRSEVEQQFRLRHSSVGSMCFNFWAKHPPLLGVFMKRGRCGDRENRHTQKRGPQEERSKTRMMQLLNSNYKIVQEPPEAAMGIAWSRSSPKSFWKKSILPTS